MSLNPTGIEWTHTLPGNGDEGDAFEHWNCRLCAHWQAWWDANERGDNPSSCNVFCLAMAGEEVPQIVCAEVSGAWPYGRAWQCLALELWRVPIPQGDERERLRKEALQCPASATT
jgi:hypothetical protein